MYKFLLAILLIVILLVLIVIFIFPKTVFNLFSNKNENVEIKVEDKPAQSNEPKASTSSNEFTDFEDIKE